MKAMLSFLGIMGSMLLLPADALLGQGTAITYQGLLKGGSGAPASGSYDFRVLVYDASSSGTVVGGPLTNSATSVSNGLFTIGLDFGPGVFSGPDRWIEIGVRSNGAALFTTLTPRQKVTALPYSITAGNLTGTVGAGQVAGVLGLAQLPASVLTNGVAAGGDLIGTYTAPRIRAGAVMSSNIADGAVTSPKIANQAVQTTNIADGAVTPKQASADLLSAGGVQSVVRGVINFTTATDVTQAFSPPVDPTKSVVLVGAPVFATSPAGGNSQRSALGATLISLTSNSVTLAIDAPFLSGYVVWPCRVGYQIVQYK